MQIFDSHCHYNLEPFSGSPSPDWRSAWQAAQAAGVVGGLVIGTTVADSVAATKIGQSEPRLGAAIGIHPSEYNSVEDWDDGVATLEKQIQALQELRHHSAVVAVGETGLDFFHLQGLPPAKQELVRRLQVVAFRRHLELAAGQLPVIIHARDSGEPAYWQILETVRQLKYDGPVVLHCVSGPLPYVQAALELGAYISVAGNVTYKNATAIRELVAAVPADRLLVETDAPFLPPVPHRGQVCQPWMIRLTVEYLVSELHRDPAQLLANSYHLFPSLLPAELTGLQ